MAMPISNDLHLWKIATGTVVTLERLEQTLMEEAC